MRSCERERSSRAILLCWRHKCAIIHLCDSVVHPCNSPALQSTGAQSKRRSRDSYSNRAYSRTQTVRNTGTHNLPLYLTRATIRSNSPARRSAHFIPQLMLYHDDEKTVLWQRTSSSCMLVFHPLCRTRTTYHALLIQCSATLYADLAS